MKYICCLFTIISLSINATAQSVKWHYQLRDVSFGQTTAKDVDGDGKLELIFATYWNDSNIYCLNAENGSLKWKHAQPGPGGGCNDAGPLLFDPFNNGNYKVVVPGSCMDTTFCYDADSGYVQWKTITGGGDSPPSMIDIDHDGYPEVLHGTFFGDIKCMDGRTGTTRWTLAVDANAAIESEPTITCSNTDTVFTVATWDFNYDSNRIACYKTSDHTLKWKYYTHNLLYHGPATGDLFRDGQKELLIGDYDGFLYCLNAADGSVRWIDSVSKPSGGYIGAPVTLADLDNDGYLDIIYTDGTMVRAVNRNDVELWRYIPPSDFTNFRGTIAADVNNDNIKDITFATYFGKVISLDGVSGNVIRSFDTRAYAADSLGNTNSIFESGNAPVIADFDHDGILDVFVICGKGRSDTSTYNDYGYAFCISWGAGHGPDWLMFRHDQQRTGCLCDANGLPLSVINVNEQEDKKCTVYPNPTNGSFTAGFYADGESGTAVYSLTDITGRAVIQHQEVLLKQGPNTLPISTDLNAGNYILHIVGNAIDLHAIVTISK